jgi:DNA ligase-1
VIAVLFSELVATSDAVARSPGRTAKRDLLAACLRRVAADEPDAVAAATAMVTGAPRQGRIGVGWRSLASAAEHAPPASTPTLSITDVDVVLDRLAGLGGPGSQAARSAALGALLSQATEAEQRFLHRLLGGELRQGALDGVVTDAVAVAAELPATVVRRAVMLGGRLDQVAVLALLEGRAAVEAVGLAVGRAVQPMLASTASSVTEALAEVGEAAVEWKLDGIRVQAHRDGDEVVLFTRNLNDITDRLPGVVEVVRALPARQLVLDGEVLAIDPATGRPVAFQDSASEIRAEATAGRGQVTPFFFDLVHLDGEDLLERPLVERRAALSEVAGRWQAPGTITADAAVGEAVLASALASGHEGVVVKGAGSSYEAGRRGKAWRKVKPVHTLDLVVLAAEWGHGRRTGWLSNLHLGARAVDGSGFVMVGKTFKGLTDELLRWQTDALRALGRRDDPADGPRAGVLWVRPELVVEIAVDGAQRSTRYPGGVALRFARVVRYRPDKAPMDADTLDAVRALLA